MLSIHIVDAICWELYWLNFVFDIQWEQNLLYKGMKKIELYNRDWLVKRLSAIRLLSL